MCGESPLNHQSFAHQTFWHTCIYVTDSTKFSKSEFFAATNNTVSHIYTHAVAITLPGVVIITTPASPLPIELIATTENV